MPPPCPEELVQGWAPFQLLPWIVYTCQQLNTNVTLLFTLAYPYKMHLRWRENDCVVGVTAPPLCDRILWWRAYRKGAEEIFGDIYEIRISTTNKTSVKAILKATFKNPSQMIRYFGRRGMILKGLLKQCQKNWGRGLSPPFSGNAWKKPFF